MWDKNLWAGLNFGLELNTSKRANMFYNKPGTYPTFYLFSIEIDKPIYRFAGAWNSWLSHKSDHYGKPRFLRGDSVQLAEWIPGGPWNYFENKKWKTLSSVDLSTCTYSLIKRDGLDVVILSSKNSIAIVNYVLAITPDGIARFGGAHDCELDTDGVGRVRVLR